MCGVSVKQRSKKIAMVSNNTGILNFNILKLNEMKGSRSGRDREGKND